MYREREREREREVCMYRAVKIKGTERSASVTGKGLTTYTQDTPNSDHSKFWLKTRSRGWVARALSCLIGDGNAETCSKGWAR